MNEEPNVITGWRLQDGSVVYLGANRIWVAELRNAARLGAQELETELAWARTPEIEREIVDPYVIAADETGPRGRRAREQIRSVGPTVRPDLCREST